MTQYKLTKETQTYDGHTLYRIELTEDCKWGKKGDKGGWVESKANLQEDAWVSGDAWVYENAKVCGNAWVGGYAKIFWNAQVYGNAHVCGDAQVYGYARVCGYADVYGDAKVRGNAQVLNSSKITGGEWSTSPLQIQGSRHFFNVSSPTTIHVGCQEFNISTWQNEIEKVGRDYNYTDSQIKEYIEYFNLVEKLKNISFTNKN